MLLMHPVFIKLGNAEQAIQTPAVFTASINVRAYPFFWVVVIRIPILRRNVRIGANRIMCSARRSEELIPRAPLTTYARQGWVLVPLAARDATLRMCSITSRGTGAGKNAHAENRLVIAASTLFASAIRALTGLH